MTAEQRTYVTDVYWDLLRHVVSGVFLRHRCIRCKCGHLSASTGSSPRNARKHADNRFKKHWAEKHDPKRPARIPLVGYGIAGLALAALVGILQLRTSHTQEE